MAGNCQNLRSARKRVSRDFDQQMKMTETEARCEVCPLSAVRTGVAVRIRKLCASPEMQGRLRELGLGEDQIVKLLTSHTNFICQVCNTRLTVSEQLARLIL